MRRFELAKEKPNRFWHIQVNGRELVLHYGRCGTNGRRQTHHFETNEEAALAARHLIRERQAEGYREQPSHPSRTSPPLGIEWPRGGFIWNDALRAQLPVVRGIHAPATPLYQDAITTPPSFDRVYSPLARTAPWLHDPWGPVEARSALSSATLRSGDTAYWHELLQQCAARPHPEQALIWAVEVAITERDLAFATAALIDVAELIAPYISRWSGNSDAFKRLRGILAAAAEESHAAAKQEAAQRRGRSPLLDAVISYLFPEVLAWAELAVLEDLPEEQRWWLNESTMTVTTACRHFERAAFYLPCAKEAVLLQLHLHDEAALPFLEQLLEHARDKEDLRTLLGLLVRLHTPQLLPLLLAHIGQLEVRTALEKLAEQWPAAVLFDAMARATTSDQTALTEWVTRQALRFPAATDSALAASSDLVRALFGQRIAPSAPREAAAEALPPLLRYPPWINREQPPAIPSFALRPQLPPDGIRWPAGLWEEWRSYQLPPWLAARAEPGQPLSDHATLERCYLRQLQVAPEAHDRLLAGQRLRPGDLCKEGQEGLSVDLLLMLPDATAITLWNGIPPTAWFLPNGPAPIRALLARHGLHCKPGLIAFATLLPDPGLALALPFGIAELAPVVAHAFLQLKRSRPAATAWLRTHPEAASAALIPLAFGRERAAQRSALAALRFLASSEQQAVVREAASRYGATAATVMDLIIGVDPAAILPPRMPKLPPFFIPATLPRPILQNGGALPIQAVEHLGLMLAISTLDQPYAGLTEVKAACNSDSLARFAWGLFEAWHEAGAPKKEVWAFHALAHLGDDDVARRLAGLIRDWPGQAAHARAVIGLEILAAIGSDVALMQLDRLANKVKFKGLKEKAAEKVAQIALARGLTTDELADRLVPDLGLDPNGTAELSFGPRRFFVTFDEQLRPWVRDEEGHRLPQLPPPTASDDPTLAATAQERFQLLQREVDSMIAQQVRRLEQAMCERRRWPLAELRPLFLDHPLLRQLARRLVWAAWREGGLYATFHITAELTLADHHATPLELPAGCEVGVAHPLDLSSSVARAFAERLDQQQLQQPFPQLERETYTLEEHERQRDGVTRFATRPVATDNLMGLLGRGWEHGAAEETGWIGWFIKPLPAGLEAVLEIDPGTYIEDPAAEPIQVVTNITVQHRRADRGQRNPPDLGLLDPVVISELLRDAALLGLDPK